MGSGLGKKDLSAVTAAAIIIIFACCGDVYNYVKTKNFLSYLPTNSLNGNGGNLKRC